MFIASHLPSCRRARHLVAVVLLAGGLSAGLPLPAEAGALYRWTDAEGGVHFSDSLPLQEPPGGFQGETPATVGDALAEEQERARIERRAALLRALAEDEKARERAALEAAMAAEMARKTIVSPYTCEEARQILEAQRRPRRTYFVLDKDGNYQPRSPEQAQATIAEWEQAVEQLCAEDVDIVLPGSPEAQKALGSGEPRDGETGTAVAPEAAIPQ